MSCTDPPLTTVRQPIEAIGRAAVEMLAGQIEGAAVSADELFFEPEIVARGSTANVPARRLRLCRLTASATPQLRTAAVSSHVMRVYSRETARFCSILHSFVGCAMLAAVTQTDSTATAVAAEPDAVERGRRRTAGAPWWRDAVVYQVYVRSFADANGDGIGDLAGVRARLPYLRELGVDALWFNPWYPSPLADTGYDVVGLPRRSIRRSARSRRPSS